MIGLISLMLGPLIDMRLSPKGCHYDPRQGLDRTTEGKPSQGPLG